MKDKELDDLFHRNADYLADEPVRDFDKAAFWQQLNSELPRKTESRKKPAAWWWAAASVLLAGMLGGMWWMKSPESGVEKQLADKSEVHSRPESVETPSHVAEGLGGTSTQRSQQPSPANTTEVSPVRDRLPQNPLAETKQKEVLFAGKQMPDKVPSALPLPPEIAPMVSTTLQSVVEDSVSLPEVTAPAIPEKPAYRVVHINEIRERKQQEAKTRSRLAVRIGLPSGSRTTTQTNNKPFLSIPIQH